MVSLIKELNEPKICSKKDKKNHDQKNNIFDKECKNKINVLSSTIRSIDEIPTESNHNENADENNVNCHDRISDRNMVKNNFNSNNNDKIDDIKSIVNYKNHDVSDSKISNISGNFNENVNVHNYINSNYDNDEIEDVECGAEQSFFVANTGRTDRNVSQILASDRTDRQTDTQTDAISIL